MEIKKKLQNCDYILVLSVFALAIFGIIIIGSATRININGPQSEYISQMIWFVTGIFLMIIAALINYENLCKFYIFIYIFNIIILILVLLIGTGNNDGNVRRWLFGLQPSEFAKIFMIIYIAKMIESQLICYTDLKAVLETFISLLRAWKFIRHWKRKRRICCIL